MKSSTILSLVGVAVILLVIGTVLGSVAFPMTKTETTTQTAPPMTETQTTTQTVSNTIIVSTTVIQTQISTTSTTTSTSITCSISGSGTGSYVTVESDAGQPIQGVQVSGIVVTLISNGGPCPKQNIGIFVTNSTGSVLIASDTGSYYLLTMLYQGVNYTATAPIRPMQSTYVTLKVPSGNVSINEIPFGGCQRNASGTVCP
jgi:hypothetical protein